VQLASVQFYCAVSSVKQYSTQTVHRPTAALPSGFWHHWIYSLPIFYTATGTEFPVELGVEIYGKPDNEASIDFWNICVPASFYPVSVREILLYYNMDDTSWTGHVDWSRI